MQYSMTAGKCAQAVHAIAAWQPHTVNATHQQASGCTLEQSSHNNHECLARMSHSLQVHAAAAPRPSFAHLAVFKRNAPPARMHQNQTVQQCKSCMSMFPTSANSLALASAHSNHRMQLLSGDPLCQKSHQQPIERNQSLAYRVYNEPKQ